MALLGLGFCFGVWWFFLIFFLNYKELNSSVEAAQSPGDDSVEDRAYSF